VAGGRCFRCPSDRQYLSQKIGTDLDVPSSAYDGVSYCWGPYEEFRFLMGLWIDASKIRGIVTVREELTIILVCINQADISEKGEQVRLIGNTYAPANQVHVWLGPCIPTNLTANVCSE
jgi:hypothetical protein